MTVKETAQALAAISSAYPNHDRFASEQAVEGMAKIWAATFAEDDAKLVQLAVAKHIQTNKWPPSIAEIREIMLTIQCPDMIQPDEAWIAVTDLLYASGDFGDESDKLPDLIRTAVKAVGWSNLRELRRQAITGGKPGLDRVAFMDIYRPLFERERQRQQVTASVRNTIDDITDKLAGDGRKKIEAARREREDREQTLRRLELGFLRGNYLIAEDPEIQRIEEKEETNE